MPLVCPLICSCPRGAPGLFPVLRVPLVCPLICSCPRGASGLAPVLSASLLPPRHSVPGTAAAVRTGQGRGPVAGMSTRLMNISQTAGMCGTVRFIKRPAAAAAQFYHLLSARHATVRTCSYSSIAGGGGERARRWHRGTVERKERKEMFAIRLIDTVSAYVPYVHEYFTLSFILL